MNSTIFLKVYDNLNSKFHYLGEIMDELIKKGAVELSRLIKNGSTSSEEVVKAHLKRIKEVNPEINACLLYTSPSPRDSDSSRMPSSA